MAIGTKLYGALAPSAASGMRYFGGADYGAALNSGHTNLEIFNWINSNFSKLSPGKKNQPGGGGLYDQIQQRAQSEQQVAAQNQLRQQEIAKQEALQQQAEAAQAEKLKQMEIGDRTRAANLSQSGLQSSLQIQSQSNSPLTSGTQAFRRRKLQVNPSAYSALASGAGKQSTSPGVLNI